MKLNLLFLFFTISIIANSQINVSGKIFSKDMEALPYTTIEALSMKDSSLLGVTSSDTTGFFNLSILHQNKIVLKVSLVGYSPLIKPITIDSTKSNIKVDSLILTPTTNLTEVVVSYKEKLIEKKIDRIVFNTANDINNSNDAIDLLMKTPLIQVSNTDITVIGKGGDVRILLNDRLLPLSGEDLIDFLKSIPASDIERIEVITNPPAKYDAVGGALINIVTKKYRLLGTNGSINTSYTQAFYPTGQMGFNLNHRNQKVNIYGSGNFTYGSTRLVEKTTINNDSSAFNQSQYTKKEIRSFYGNAGVDYDINKKNTISLLYSTSYRNTDAPANSTANYSNLLGLVDSTMYTNSVFNRNTSNNSLDLNFLTKLDSTGKEITVDMDYVLYNSQSNMDFTSNTYSEPISTTENTDAIYNTSTQLINIWTINTDMELPMKYVSLDYGFKLNWINNHSSNNIYNGLGNNQTLDTGQSNSYVYTEQTQACYFSADKTFKKLEVKLGLRLENTLLNGYTPFEGQQIDIVNKDYLNLFPTAYFLYNLNDNNTLSFSYDYRIDRPEYNALNPFRYYQTPYIYFQGNPYLQPSYPTSVDLSYTLKQTYILGLTYSGFRNSYLKVPMQVNGVDIAYLEENIGSTDQYGFYTIVPFKIQSFMDLNFVLAYVNSNFYSSNSDYPDLKKNVVVCNINAQFYLDKGKNISAEFSSHIFPFGSTYTISDMNSQYVISSGIKVYLFNKTVSLKAGINDIFLQSSPSGIINSNSLKILYNNEYDTRNFKISISYKFGNNRIKPKRQIENSDNEEKNRLSN